MKETYASTELEITLFKSVDVILTSGDTIGEGEEDGDG